MTTLPASHGISRRARWLMGAGAALLFLAAWPRMSRLAGQLVFALLLTALALPLCKRIESRLPRPWAAGCAVAVLALCVVGLIGLMAPMVIPQISLIIAEAPRMLENVQALWDKLAQREWARLLGLDSEGPGQWIARLSQWLRESLPGLIAGIGSAIDALSQAFLSPALAYYFLRDREIVAYKLSLWIPLRHRRRVLTALQEMRREAGGYIRGQTLVALAVGVLTALGLFFVGIPAWLVLGLLMGACEFIPYIGPLIGGVPIVLFSLPQGASALLWGLGVTVFVQQLEGYFLSPRLMGGATGLHPVSVLLLLSLGGLMGGLIGMVAAVPAFVCVRGAVRVLYETRDNFSL